jgi:hypothetical protein
MLKTFLANVQTGLGLGVGIVIVDVVLHALHII